MLLKATLDGNLKQAMQEEVRRVSGALRRGITTAAQQAQADFRAQARAAGFKDGGKNMANAWRMEVYPGAGKTTLRPAALVFSKMPDVVAIFDKGAYVRADKHEYLAWPTAINRTSSRRVNGQVRMRVTPQEMYRSGGFVVPTKNARIRLWCLPLRTQKTKRGRTQLSAGAYARIMTGNRKGAEALRAAYARDRKFVPMFVLTKQVYLRKRLDLAQIRNRAAAAYARAAAAEVGRLAS